MGCGGRTNVGVDGETMKLILTDYHQNTNTGDALQLYNLTRDPWEESPLDALASPYTTTLLDTLSGLLSSRVSLTPGQRVRVAAPLKYRVHNES